MATNQGWGVWEVNLGRTPDAGVNSGGAVAGSIISATTDNNRVDTNGEETNTLLSGGISVIALPSDALVASDFFLI
jgi:hypothetical protein